MLTSNRGLSITAVFAVLLAVAVPFAFAAKSEEGGEKERTHLFGNHECPVSGDPVDPTTFAEYKDEENQAYGRVYVCCKACVEKAEEQASDLYKKYYRTDAETGKEIEAVNLENEKCPISGGGVAESGMIEYNGMVVGHCCDKCPAKFLADPETHLGKLVNDELKEKYELN